MKRLQEMERTNRELAERLDAAQSRHDQQMKALLEQIAKLSKKVEGGGSGSGGGGAGSGGGGHAVPRNANAGGGGSGRDGAGTPGTRNSPVPGYGVSGSRPRRSTR